MNADKSGFRMSLSAFQKSQSSEHFGDMEVGFGGPGWQPREVAFGGFWADATKQVHAPKISGFGFRDSFTPRDPHKNRQLIVLEFCGCGEA